MTFKTLAATLFTLSSLALNAAGAHAVVRTDAGASVSAPGAYETYRLQVPVEKDQATVEVRLFVPEGLTVNTFLPVPGFARTVERGPDGKIRSVTWKGRIEPLEFQRFLFSARNPAQTGELSFVVEQKYQDGTVVAWKDASGATPASRVKIAEPGGVTPVSAPHH